MKFSIVTVCLNSEETIASTLDSVAEQDWPHREHLIIDGGSTDRTGMLVQNRARGDVKWFSEPDTGIYSAMNKGLAKAEGDIIAFLNSDDFYADPKVLSDVAGIFQTEKADAVYGDIVYVSRTDAQRICRYWKTGRWQPGSFQRGWVIPHPAFFCRKDIYVKLGGYREDFQVAGDFELLLRFVEIHRIRCVYRSRVLVKMRTGGKAGRWSGIWQGNQEILRSFRIHRLKPAPFFFVRKVGLKCKQVFSALAEKQVLDCKPEERKVE
jgi:glycosyltransferase involved in cell wall biosynthesis